MALSGTSPDKIVSLSVKHTESVEEIFSALLSVPVEHRADRVHFHCGENSELRCEVESLLAAADKAKGFLSIGPLQSAWPGGFDSATLLGQQFGSWQIIRELDSGGMGVVFLAERNDGHYQQQVAIKLARLGIDSGETADRFHTERQILANLRHPNIAQLLDGGTSRDGYPYLVMEYVQGVAIDTWCESQRLSIDQILRIVITVCDAVQYAHSNLIVHCDLKPSNILVSDGVPKLLDFGIATLLRPAVTSCPVAPCIPVDEAQPLTPTFAAPEQMRGESVTTATDIYALGVVLYRLLAGTYPYSLSGLSHSQVLHVVVHGDIPPPSSKAGGKRKSKLRGELDSIVAKALDKDPRLRYSSVLALSTDLKRYLAGYPVSVGASSWWYQSYKFCKRHKWIVALALVAVMSLWVGSFVSIWQWQSAKDKHNLAEQRLADVRSMISTLVVDLPDTISTQPGSTRLRVQLLSQGIERLDELVKSQNDNPELTRELAVAYAQLGRLQGNPASINLGEPTKAAVAYEKSLSLRLDLLKKFPDDLDLVVEIAANYASLTVINFAVLRNSRLAYEYVDECQKILLPLVISNDSRVFRWLLGCYSLEAKWRSDDRNYLVAKKALIAAEELVMTRIYNHPFWQSYDGYRLRARLHEEWAEIEANIGSIEKAIDHEQKRLDITLTQLQDDNGLLGHYDPIRITGDALQAYAARLAMAGKYRASENALTKAASIWTGLLEQFPADSSAMRSLLYIYADFAELYRRAAVADTAYHIKEKRKRQACDAYEQSVRFVDKMSVNGEKIAKRYSWSPMPAEIRQRYEGFCVGGGKLSQ